MSNLREMLKGKKTYALAFLGALLTFAHLMGWLDMGAYNQLMALLGFGGLAALRAGVKK